MPLRGAIVGANCFAGNGKPSSAAHLDIKRIRGVYTDIKERSGFKGVEGRGKDHHIIASPY